MSWARTWRTARHLRAGQVFDRIRRTLRPFSALPPADAPYRLAEGTPVPAAAPGADRWTDDGFELLGVRRPFEGADRWNPEGAPRLWVYHLQYMASLEGMSGDDGLRLVRDWMQANADPRGPGWEPYPLSRRIRAWSEWALATRDLLSEARMEIASSLAQQTEALHAQLEFHLLGNHVLENAITLCWAGLRLEGPRAPAWRRRGLALLDAQLAAQALPDGTHEERTPMYQAQLADGLRRLAGVARQGRAAEAARIAGIAEAAARRWTSSLGPLVHPDGDYALLNDTSLAGAPRHAALLRALGQEPAPPEVGPWHLPDAGYAGWRDADGGYLVMDVGPIGPDHQPGHGHADCLAFEYSQGGRRIVTDTGVSTYEVGPDRAYDRSTAAHSTVEVDGRDQSELWAAFRCGRRIRVLDAGVASSEDGGVELRGAYRGPGPARHRVVHRRRLRVGSTGVAAVDELEARGMHRCTVRLHLGPGLRVESAPEGLRIHDAQGARIGLATATGFAWREARSPYRPSFGEEVARVVLEGDFTFEGHASLGWALRMEPACDAH